VQCLTKTEEEQKELGKEKEIQQILFCFKLLRQKEYKLSPKYDTKQVVEIVSLSMGIFDH